MKLMFEYFFIEDMKMNNTKGTVKFKSYNTVEILNTVKN